MSPHRYTKLKMPRTTKINVNKCNTVKSNTAGSLSSSPMTQSNVSLSIAQQPVSQQYQGNDSPVNTVTQSFHGLRARNVSITQPSNTTETNTTIINSSSNRSVSTYPYTLPRSRESSSSPPPQQEEDSNEPLEIRTCQTCDIVFSRARDYRRHLRKSNAHDAPAAFQCYLCKKEFKRCDVIKRHTYNKKCIDTFLNLDDSEYEAK